MGGGARLQKRAGIRGSVTIEAQRQFEIREHCGDGVAGAVAHFQRAMMMDVDQAAKAMKDAEIEDFLEGFKQPAYRGMRSMGSG